MTVAWLAGCDSINPFSSGPECTPYVAPSQPPPAPEKIGDARRIVPTDVCDDSIKIENDKPVCADPAKEYSITAGGNNDLNKRLVTVTVASNHVRIDWDAKSLPHAIIVGDTQWGYVNGPDSEGVGQEVAASLLYNDDWGSGDLPPIRVCNK
jgi:hypothetical protein